MGALPKPLPGYMTVAEFLEWDSGDDSGRLWQLRDGMPEAMAPPRERHGTIEGNLAALIGGHLLRSDGNCRLVVTPGVVPRVRAADNVRIPDLAVTCAPPADRPLMAEPVLLIEILSHSNAAKTWANVWSYTTIAGVAEILVVSSFAMMAELLRRQPDRLWPEQPARVGAGDTLDLHSIGLAVPLAAVYRNSGIG